MRDLRGVVLRGVPQGHSPKQEAVHRTPPDRAHARLAPQRAAVPRARGREGQHVLRHRRSADLLAVQIGRTAQGPPGDSTERPLRKTQGRQRCCLVLHHFLLIFFSPEDAKGLKCKRLIQ